ncbi:TetR/AcrR family transcriptional regulator [Sulfurivermis fontis]|jgi:TetR/AcrR family transcriptional repressor of nem operon|uniref:TetR/AcrR family transcriptional regulator n=1 Tax=Sulfurivermis fontis TaxID=1972068 RepID=UPI000FD7BAF7|nr:TetR/AcrR family transcriptional regulator [Sulfurivermis fontis]
MARPIEFDRDQALREAMQLFWRRGYNRTSVRDLTEATRLKPGSLYGAFASKRALFAAALDSYGAELARLVDELLRGEAPPLERIARFFDHLLADMAGDPERKGCLLVNTLLEVRADDSELARHAGDALARVEQAMGDALEEAAARGELPTGAQPRILASLLMTGIFGLRVYSRMRPDSVELRHIVDTLLAMVRAPR